MRKLLFIPIIISLLTSCNSNRKRVLDVFIKAKNATASNPTLDSAISRRFADMQLQYKRDPIYLKPIYLVSEIAMQASDSLIKQIEEIKLLLVTKEIALSRKEVIAVNKKAHADSLMQTLTDEEWNDTEAPKEVLTVYKIRDLTQEQRLKMLITKHRKRMISLLSYLNLIKYYHSLKDTERMDIGLLLPAKFADNEGNKKWSCFSFAPLVADIIQLNQLQNTVKKTELRFLDYFYENIQVN